MQDRLDASIWMSATLERHIALDEDKACIGPLYQCCCDAIDRCANVVDSVENSARHITGVGDARL